MRILRPLPPHVSRLAAVAVVAAWVWQMGVLVDRAFLRDRPAALAGELSQYSSAAQWKGVYYRGEKIGFMVSQTVPHDDGYEIQEDGRLRLSLLGMTATTRISSRVMVDAASELQSFSFSLDPGTGAIKVEGRLDGLDLHLAITNSAGTRTEVRHLSHRPSLSLNFARELVAGGIREGKQVQMEMFDPATLRDAPMTVDVKQREIVKVAGLPLPAYRVESHYLGLVITSWITDTGEVVREESPLGMIVVRESPEAATRMAVPGDIQADMASNLAVVPSSPTRIDDPAEVERLRLRLDGADDLLASSDVQGAGQRVVGREVAIDPLAHDVPQVLPPEAARRYLSPETFIESDDPAIVAEARQTLQGVKDPVQRIQLLVHRVHAIIDKKPSMGIPSAAEVLRTRVGDCNEHAVLLTALARASGIPARVVVGLVDLLGAFYYHAWVEVFVAGPGGRGFWMGVDPTLDQIPVDATHVRLARGGLDRQAALVASMGRMQISLLDVESRPDTTHVVVGRNQEDIPVLDMPLRPSSSTEGGCWFVRVP